MFTSRRQHPGVHTGQGGLAPVGSSAISAVAVIALIGALLLMFGQRADRVSQIEAVQAGSQRAAPIRAQPIQEGAPAGQPPIPVAPGPDDQMGAVPGPIVPRGSVPDPVTEPVEDPKGSFTEEQIAAAAKAPVVLFNQTYSSERIEGLRQVLTVGGWTVHAVDDWNGAVPTTTVYYPKGMELEARALMSAFPSIGRIKPAFAGIPNDKLTVIICKDLPILR